MAEAFYDAWISQYGHCEVVTNDNGGEFAKGLAHMLAMLGVKHILFSIPKRCIVWGKLPGGMSDREAVGPAPAAPVFNYVSWVLQMWLIKWSSDGKQSKSLYNTVLPPDPKLGLLALTLLMLVVCHYGDRRNEAYSGPPSIPQPAIPLPMAL